MNAGNRPPAAKLSLEVETTAEAYLAVLAQRGIERLFVNAGTDFASIVEAYARQPQSGLRFPQYTVCAHETVAFGMAHGHYLATGRPAAVMVHVSPGTANTICGLMNAARDHSPVILTAGRNPLFEQGRRGARSVPIHWAQEMFDQAGMVRELVKWDYELRDGLQVADVVDRAVTIAMAPPRGPVYLTLPREVLAQEQQGVAFAAAGTAVPTDPAPDPAALQALVDMLGAAKRPVFVVNESGRAPAAVAALARVAEGFGAGVIEVPRALVMCLPATHPMHLGYDINTVIAEADLLVVMATDVPWLPLLTAPRQDAKIVHVAVDPLFSRIPVRAFPSDLSITASSAALLEALARRLPEPALVAARRAHFADVHKVVQEVRAKKLAAAMQGPRITLAMLNACLDAARPKDAIVVNEYWSDRSLVDIDEPCTWFSHSMAGGLGWGLPAALGIQQAQPDRTVIATIGDGAYVFANPPACHMAAQAEGLPVLTIILNNSHWAAVKRAALQVYPDGHASKLKMPPMAGLPTAAYEKYVEASGGYGARIDKPEDLLPGILAALDVVRKERRQAVLNVICD